MFTIKKHKVNYSMRDCVNRDGKIIFMMTSQTRINKSEFLLFRWIIPVVLISILNKSVCTSSTTNL